VNLTQELLPALIGGAAYCLGLIFIYLLTPNDLTWQLDCSVERTMFSVNACFFVVSYFILNSIENEKIKTDFVSSQDCGGRHP
jgi:hypothetical protein